MKTKTTEWLRRQVLADGRITIPSDEREFLGIKEGDWIQVKVRTLPKEEVKP